MEVFDPTTSRELFPETGSYTYSMLIVASTIFRKMCFPHNRKIVTIDHLTYYDPQYQTYPQTTISSVARKNTILSLTIVSRGVYKDSTLLGPYYVSSPTHFLARRLRASMGDLREPLYMPDESRMTVR